MQIKLIVAGAAIALIAGVGSVSADELSVADTTVAQDTPFALLDGIATEQMSIQELASARGAAGLVSFKLFKYRYAGNGAGAGKLQMFIFSASVNDL